MMKYLSVPFAVVALLGSPAHGQVDSQVSAKVTRPQLRQMDSMPVPSQTGGIFQGSIKCDGDGNIYFRRYEVDRPKLSPVTKISDKGRHKATFAPSALSDPHLTEALYFSASLKGELYWPGFAADERAVYVVNFDKDGSSKSEIKLDEEFIPFQLAVFKSGEFLLAGLKYDNPALAGTERPFAAIFASNGKLLRKVSLEDDNNIMEAARRGDIGVVSPINPVVNRALNLGEALASNDGNVYLLRRLSPAIVYAISPAGKVVRRITVDTPRGVMPTAMQVSGNRLAIDFWDNDTESGTIKLVDTQTGNELASYEYGASLGPMFACYSSEQENFSFLTVDQDKLTLVRASVY
jgi:hypothetical protein